MHKKETKAGMLYRAFSYKIYFTLQRYSLKSKFLNTKDTSERL